MQNHSLLIGGKHVATSHHQDVKNPSTGEVAGTMPLATEAQVNQAIASAKAAFDSWKDTSDADRAQACMAIAAKIEEHSEELAVLLVHDEGPGNVVEYPVVHLLGRCLPSIDPAHSLGDVSCALISVPLHPLDPLGIEQFGANDPPDLIAQGENLHSIGISGITVVGLNMVPRDLPGGRSQTSLVSKVTAGAQQVPLIRRGVG